MSCDQPDPPLGKGPRPAVNGVDGVVVGDFEVAYGNEAASKVPRGTVNLPPAPKEPCEIVHSGPDCDEGCCWEYYCAHGKMCTPEGIHLDEADDECTCGRESQQHLTYRDPQCPDHGDAKMPQNYDEIEAVVALIYGNSLPDSMTKGALRDACIGQVMSMRRPDGEPS